MNCSLTIAVTYHPNQHSEFWVLGLATWTTTTLPTFLFGDPIIVSRIHHFLLETWFFPAFKRNVAFPRKPGNTALPQSPLVCLVHSSYREALCLKLRWMKTARPHSFVGSNAWALTGVSQKQLQLRGDGWWWHQLQLHSRYRTWYHTGNITIHSLRVGWGLRESWTS